MIKNTYIYAVMIVFVALFQAQASFAECNVNDCNSCFNRCFSDKFAEENDKDRNECKQWKQPIFSWVDDLCKQYFKAVCIAQCQDTTRECDVDPVVTEVPEKLEDLACGPSPWPEN